MKIYAEGRKDGDFDHGVEAGLEAVLVSPSFLFIARKRSGESRAGRGAPHLRPGTGHPPVFLPVEQRARRRAAEGGTGQPAAQSVGAEGASHPHAGQCQIQCADPEFRRPVALPAPAGISEARPPRLPGFRRAAARRHADRSRNVLRPCGARQYERPGFSGCQLHLCEPAAGGALRHPHTSMAPVSARWIWTRRCIAAACWGRARC